MFLEALRHAVSSRTSIVAEYIGQYLEPLAMMYWEVHPEKGNPAAAKALPAREREPETLIAPLLETLWRVGQKLDGMYAMHTSELRERAKRFEREVRR